MPQTKLANLVDPQVMADMVSAKLPKKIKFSPIARIDTTLVGRPGSTIVVPKYAYIGDAVNIASRSANCSLAISTPFSASFSASSWHLYVKTFWYALIWLIASCMDF